MKSTFPLRGGRRALLALTGIVLAAAVARAGEQVLYGRPALRIAQFPQVLPDQIGLARMHQHPARQVIDEEVAVVAELQLAQYAQRLVACCRFVARRQVGNAGQRQRHVVLQFVPA